MLIFGGTPHVQDVQVEAVTAAADHNAYGIRIDSAGSQTSPVRVENVRATGRNGSFTLGLNIHNCFITVNKAHCLAKDGDQNRGLYIASNSQAVTVANSYAGASGGSTATAIGIENATAAFSNVTAVGTGGSASSNGMYAIGAQGPLTVTVDHSRIAGTEHSIGCSDLDYTFFVGSSKLEGPASPVGTWHCVRCYDETNTDLDSACQRPF